MLAGVGQVASHTRIWRLLQQDNVPFVVIEIWTDYPRSSPQSKLSSLQGVVVVAVCLVWCECTWGPSTVGYCCIVRLTVTVWQALQALTSSCSVHSSCHSVSHSVPYCSLFTPAVWNSATNTCTEVWSGSSERSCQKQEHCRVPTGTRDTWPTCSWGYTNTTHTKWEEEVQS